MTGHFKEDAEPVIRNKQNIPHFAAIIILTRKTLLHIFPP